MTPYQHTQIGNAILYPLVGVACLGFAMAAFSSNTGAAIPALALLIVALLFWKLTVTVDEKALLASFGPGLIYKEVPIREVDRCEPMQVRWWHGWGIRFTANGWLYNVSGPDAVIVTLRDGCQFCVGTDEPQELMAAIRRFASAR